VRSIFDIQWSLNQHDVGGGGDDAGGGGDDFFGGDDDDDDVGGGDDDDDVGGGVDGSSDYEDDNNDDDSDISDDDGLYYQFVDAFADYSDECSAVVFPGRKKGDTLDRHDQDKRFVLAYNACVMKFMAQRGLATAIRGKNAKPPHLAYERIIVEVEDSHDV
jgi:hypothetical protein